MSEKQDGLIKSVSVLIGNFGFPIIVTGWLLWERMTTMTQITEAINKNTQVMAELIRTMGG